MRSQKMIAKTPKNLPAPEPNFLNAAFLLEVTREPIVFQRTYVDLTQSVTAALLLSSLQQIDQDHSAYEDGWFHISSEECHALTGLTRYEQESARKILKTCGFLEEKRKGMPAKLLQRINYQKLTSAIKRQAEAMMAGGI